MAALTTSQSARLIAYTCDELSAYTWDEINSLPYGIGRAMTAAERTAAARGEKLQRAQQAAEQVDIVAYSALEQAIGQLETAANGLLQSVS